MATGTCDMAMPSIWPRCVPRKAQRCSNRATTRASGSLLLCLRISKLCEGITKYSVRLSRAPLSASRRSAKLHAPTWGGRRGPVPSLNICPFKV